jgi:hypothetical protein
MVPKESRILKRFGKWTHMECSENVFSTQNIGFPFFKRERLWELFFLSHSFSMPLSLSLFLCSVSHPQE